MPAFGKDFLKSKASWNYPVAPMQGIWRAILFFVLLFVLNFGLQYVFGALVYNKILHAPADQMLTEAGMADFAKASIVGLFPAAMLVVAISYYVSKIGLPNQKGSLPLHLPSLGFLGWAVTVIGFVVLMYLIFFGLFAALGIDPETYSPAGGLSDKGSAAGMVEKTMADLAKQPFLFALAIPGVTIAVPIAEEFVFRGALFAGLVNSPVGRIGAVLITAALWALAHALTAPWLVVGVLFLMGLCLGVLLLRFGSLWVTIACHCVWNSLSSLALFSTGHH